MKFNGKIDAIKHVREICYIKQSVITPSGNPLDYYERMGLREAKDIVEATMAIIPDNVMLQKRIDDLRNELSVLDTKYRQLVNRMRAVLNDPTDDIKF